MGDYRCRTMAGWVWVEGVLWVTTEVGPWLGECGLMVVGDYRVGPWL